MDVRFPKMQVDILAAEVGATLIYEALSGQEIRQRMGDIQYFFTGHVEPGDQRMNEPGGEHITPDWNWRCAYHYARNKVNPLLWDLTVTKIPAPLEQLYDGQKAAIVREINDLQARLDAAQIKFDQPGS